MFIGAWKRDFPPHLLGWSACLLYFPMDQQMEGQPYREVTLSMRWYSPFVPLESPRMPPKVKWSAVSFSKKNIFLNYKGRRKKRWLFWVVRTTDREGGAFGVCFCFGQKITTLFLLQFHREASKTSKNTQIKLSVQSLKYFGSDQLFFFIRGFQTNKNPPTKKW